MKTGFFKSMLFAFLTFSFNESVIAQCRLDYSNYQLVFEENFDNISSINQLAGRSMFRHDEPGWGWGDVRNANGTYQSYGEYYDQSQVSIQPGGIWSHSWLPYTYSSPTLGYANGDLAKSSLDWGNSIQRVCYAGFDGRIQCFTRYGTSWAHAWIDDYWNTDEYSSFNSNQNSNTSASVKFGFDAGDRSKFYTRKDNHLAYFKYENCEVLNPVNNSWRSLNRLGIVQAALETEKIDIYPNPANDILHIRGLKNSGSFKEIKIFNVSGSLVSQITSRDDEPAVSLEKLSPGIYVMEVDYNGGKHHFKFSKQ
ncbi:T9SS type A sorting domain-containing protein [Taibaiella soli]|uniref:Secretion system C-terminal sorting domain-containing protein n=1 Tax=Taibaiella soli TaxID=1649169 RepID=A0A2W2B9L9_9BACT|nr:T9SS type A sorting domain-containing protein [Taibaiella soli]PZF72979.1 hypothetical protein DN068_11245 [Taibaiella soli]